MVYYKYFFAWMFAFLLVFSNPNSLPAQHTDPLILQQLEEKEAVQVLINFGNIDAFELDKNLDKSAKGRYIMERSRAATLIQTRVLQFLTKQAVDYKSFWLVNAIRARVSKKQLEALQQFPEIQSITYDIPVKLERPGIGLEQRTNNNKNWGIEKIGANLAWESGFDGSGVVIGGQDTGVDWEHPELIANYRGYNGTEVNHTYNWHDAIYEEISGSENPCGYAINVPCDDTGHGTHTVGTMAGTNIESPLSIAPKAQWIACRNMDNGVGSPSTYIECFEWFLAPTDTAGLNPDPAKAPDIINNSWSCPSSEGCNEQNWSLMETAINKVQQAGILVVVSAGNSGPNCNTIISAPAIFPEVLAVGATNELDTITGFSSRGPVSYEDSIFIKPDLTAPGRNIYSSFLQDGYISFSGTSMAAPHVAGLAALLIQSNPDLRGDVVALQNALIESCRPAGARIACERFENVVGAGRIDAALALKEYLTTSNEVSIENTELVIYPNPALNHLSVTLGNRQEEVEILILNAKGQQVFRSKERLPAELSIQNLVSGVYNLYLIGDSFTKRKRLIKK